MENLSFMLRIYTDFNYSRVKTTLQCFPLPVLWFIFKEWRLSKVVVGALWFKCLLRCHVGYVPVLCLSPCCNAFLSLDLVDILFPQKKKLQQQHMVYSSSGSNFQKYVMTVEMKACE